MILIIGLGSICKESGENARDRIGPAATERERSGMSVVTTGSGLILPRNEKTRRNGGFSFIRMG